MILSMTGFGKAQNQFKWGNVVVEVRSINSRSLDFKMRCPSRYSGYEAEIKTLASKVLLRGKVDLQLNVDRGAGESTSTIDIGLAKSYFKQVSNLAEELNLKTEGMLQTVLRMPEVVRTKEGEIDETEWEEVHAVIHEALTNAVDFRANEGENLRQDLLNSLAELRRYLQEIELLAPERIETRRRDLKKKLEDAQMTAEIDVGRFEQEMLYFIEKLDINEEVVRLKSHCDYFEEIVNSNSSQGKKLGFIGQEMGREINTIGSKANHSGIQKHVVCMKDELEKIKEQSLNISLKSNIEEKQ